jgi:hypothetical protein
VPRQRGDRGCRCEMPPRSRGAQACRWRTRDPGSAFTTASPRLTDGIEVLQHDATLDDEGRFRYFVVRVPEVAVDLPGIDLKVVARERPEATVGVAVLLADPGVQHERSPRQGAPRSPV